MKVHVIRQLSLNFIYIVAYKCDGRKQYKSQDIIILLHIYKLYAYCIVYRNFGEKNIMVNHVPRNII